MSRINSERRIDYAGSVHDEREIEAVVEVLRGGPTSMRIGKNVKAMERRVADLFEKKRGVMCNSGSSALYLAYEAIDLQPGDEIVTSAVTPATAPASEHGAIHLSSPRSASFEKRDPSASAADTSSSTHIGSTKFSGKK